MDGPTKFFFSWKKEWSKQTYTFVILMDGTEIVEPKEIRKRAVIFYSELYMSENTEADELAKLFLCGFAQSFR